MESDADSKELPVQKHAAGFVLYRRAAAGLEYLLLRNAGHGDIGLPKGHRSGAEDDLATALRETEEETGLRPDPNPWFRRAVRYEVKGKLKEVIYFAAETGPGKVRLSREHDEFSWLGLADALERVRHETLRVLLREAAVFLKDPALRTGLSPAGARALLVDRAGAGAPVVAHTTEVAAMARALADAWDGIDADYVEAAAWVHDVGRSVSNDTRHTIEGFRLLVDAGHPGYAPPCLSHYTKGRPHDECGELADEMWRLCDLETFSVEEQLVALADFMAAGPRRVTLEERHADLVARYGASRFLDHSLECARGIRDEFEERTGRRVYQLAGVG
jgi:8-oxo-dGTP pyrophosphatase MutT (NUDIX family)